MVTLNNNNNNNYYYYYYYYYILTNLRINNRLKMKNKAINL